MSEKPARAIKLNVLNEPKDSYTGGPSSLCPGCGHDQISNVIVTAAWENGIEPHRIAKMSGIGCSSKTPAYYLGQSHGFNTCLLYTSPSPRDGLLSRMPSSA